VSRRQRTGKESTHIPKSSLPNQIPPYSHTTPYTPHHSPKPPQTNYKSFSDVPTLTTPPNPNILRSTNQPTNYAIIPPPPKPTFPLTPHLPPLLQNHHPTTQKKTKKKKKKNKTGGGGGGVLFFFFSPPPPQHATSSRRIPRIHDRVAEANGVVLPQGILNMAPLLIRRTFVV